MADSSQATPKGKIFDSRYQIFEIVGRGASSVVYRAKHVLNDDKEIALKVLLPNKGKEHNSDLLRHESLALITARHKNVIRLEDFRSVDSICYLAMEYAPEANLSVYCQKQETRIPVAQAERFFMQITEALAFLHNIGMLHRDIKPENILVINNRQVRLSDFGVATLPGQTTTSDELQKGVGTLDYMAPEIFKGEASGPGSDVYSLALTFYEIFSGHHPFKNLSLAQAMDAREQMSIAPLHVINKEIPVHLSKAISIALEGDLEKRFYNAIELLNFLKNKDQIIAEEAAIADPLGELVQEVPVVPVKPVVSKTPTEKIQVKLAPEPRFEFGAPEKNQVEVEEQAENWDDYDEEEFADLEDLTIDSSSENNTDYVHVSPPEVVEDFYDELETAQEEVHGHADRDTPANYNDFNYQQPVLNDRRTPLWQTLLFYLVAIGVGYFAYQSFFAGSAELSPESQVAGNETTNDSELNFPLLPAGIYSGAINGLTSQGSTPLTLISLPNSNQIAVLVGIPGWQPVLIDAETLEAKGTSGLLSVKSNGIVLHLQGSVVDGIISGTYKNNTNNTEGTWSITPAQS